MRRGELLAPYERPYRHVAAETWRRRPELRRDTYAALALGAGGAAGLAAGQELLGLLVGVGAMLGAFVLLAWVVAMARSARRLTRAWSRRTELAAVRERRPQAGGEDPEAAHDEFAVTAEEDRTLVTWRFRPLAISEHPEEDEVEVPGRPRYAASVVGEAPFDARDVARAAEQLVAAQDEAARLEELAAAEARAALAAHLGQAELAAEARTTAAALQRATGQRTDHR